MPDPIAPCWECARRSSVVWLAAIWQEAPPYFVLCPHPQCSISGPERSTPDDAIAAWNAVAALYQPDTGEEAPAHG